MSRRAFIDESIVSTYVVAAVVPAHHVNGGRR